MKPDVPAWWHQAQRQGLVPADAQPPHAAPSPSWVVLVFGFFGAQLVLWPLLGLFGGLFSSLLHSVTGSLLGSVLFAAGAIGLAKSSRTLFVEQMALNLLFAAQMLWLWAFLQESANAHWGWIAASLLVFQLALAAGLPTGWLVRIVAFQASWTLFFLPPLLHTVEPSFAIDSAMHWVLTWPRHTLWLAALWAVWAHCESRFLTKPWGEKLAQGMESAAVGLLLALVAALAGKYFVQSQLPVQAADLGLSPQSWWALSPPQITAAIAVVVSALWLQARWQRHPLLWLVYGAALVGCAWLPSIGTITLVATFAAGTGRWRLLGLALAALLLAVGSFYYDLQWRLVDKAAVLAGIGMVMALVLWGLRRPTAAASAPSTAQATPVWTTAVLALAGVLALASTQWDVQHKEAVLADGQKIFMRLQPVDPRSLLQGDYMALRFAYPAHVHEALSAQQTTAPWLRRTLAVAQLSQDGVAEITRLAAPGETPGPGQVLLPLQLLKGQWVVVTDAFFFPEGQGAPLAQAQFGEFRALDQGRVLLVGLADGQLQPIAPGPQAGTHLLPE